MHNSLAVKEYLVYAKLALASAGLTRIPAAGPPPPPSAERLKHGLGLTSSQTVYNTKGTRAHTHRELIRKWLWEPKGSSLEYI